MKTQPLLLLMSFLLLSAFSCTTGKVVKISKTNRVVFLDSLAATEAITEDKTHQYFQQASLLDMSIQLGKQFPEGTDREVVLNEYLQLLKSDVASFSGKEKKHLKGSLKKAWKLSEKIEPGLFPKEIVLLKTHGKHYGPGAWYTRDNRIVVPANALAEPDKEALLKVTLHEVFHIWSRYNPRLRNELYAVIGFKNMAGLPLIMDAPLKERVLLNPDGVEMNQVINLTRPDSVVISAIPVTYSRFKEYNPENPAFFDHLDFNLYQVVRKGKAIRVISEPDGSSALDLRELPDFFRQIGDNTQYIIHPDEILADNFTILALSREDPDRLKALSPEGRQLIEKILEVIRKD